MLSKSYPAVLLPVPKAWAKSSKPTVSRPGCPVLDTRVVCAFAAVDTPSRPATTRSNPAARRRTAARDRDVPAGRRDARSLEMQEKTRPRRAGRIQGAGGGLAETRDLIGESGVRRRFCAGVRALGSRCPACDIPRQFAGRMSSLCPSSSSLHPYSVPLRADTGRCSRSSFGSTRPPRPDRLSPDWSGVRAWSPSRFYSR